MANRSLIVFALILASGPIAGRAQAPAGGAAAPAGAPRQSGTVKSVTASDMTLTNATGQDYTATLSPDAKVLVVAPGSKDLKSATAGTLADVAVGDKVIVTGSTGDTGITLKASRVILMKSSAIAQVHAADEAAWARGGGGIVKAVDPAAGTVTLSSGARSVTVATTKNTVVRHYSGDSVRFQDATVSSLAEVKPGDQLRVRGEKSGDGSVITAEEIVAGTFRNFSGLISSIDTAGGTVTLKDLTTKRTVTVAVTANSDVRRIPPEAAQMLAARMKGAAGAGAAGAGAGPAGSAARSGAAGPGGAPGAGGAGAGGGGRPNGGSGGPGGAGGPAGAGGGEAGTQRAGRAGADLSQMLSRLPTETLGGLKAGDAVMIVATSGAGDSMKSTAVTLLAGVEAILQASPTGEMTLSPWSVGGAAPEGGQ